MSNATTNTWGKKQQFKDAFYVRKDVNVSSYCYYRRFFGTSILTLYQRDNMVGILKDD